MYDYFKQFGSIYKVVIPYDHTFIHTNGFKGYALVTFEDSTGVNSALNKKEHFIADKKVCCTMALTKKKAKEAVAEKSRRKLYIGGIAKETTIETLEQYFAKYGEISSIYLIYHIGTNINKGFGF